MNGRTLVARMNETRPTFGENPRRLNWGCGGCVVPGWVNSDIKEGEGVIDCDIRDGLPFENDCFDYAVSIHALPELSYPEILPALEELCRVLKPRGVLRLGLPDLDKGFEAYRQGRRDYFLVNDDEALSIGGKLIAQILWFGYSQSVFVYDFIEELLWKAGFSDVYRVGFRETRSRDEHIVSLDNREEESLFVEAVK
jgi:SAM-dependent methyltransferase